VKEPSRGTIQRRLLFCSIIEVSAPTQESETQSPTVQPESAAPSMQSRRKSILALSVFALGLNAAAAVYTLSPSDFALPNVSSLAELLPAQNEQVDAKKISAQIANEHEDVKKMSAQISALIAKVDSLQNAITPAVTSSIPTGHARNRLSREARKRLARQPQPQSPLSFPATTPAPQG
jgi:hypothetical protein